MKVLYLGGTHLFIVLPSMHIILYINYRDLVTFDGAKS